GAEGEVGGGRFHADPVVGSESFDGPVAVEAAESRVFLAAEHHVGFVVDGYVVDVGHTGFDAAGEVGSLGQVLGEHGGGEAELSIVGQLQGVILIISLYDEIRRASCR